MKRYRAVTNNGIEDYSKTLSIQNARGQGKWPWNDLGWDYLVFL